MILQVHQLIQKILRSYSGILLLLLTSCNETPVYPPPPPPPPPTIEEQIAAWNPRIVVEEQLGLYAPYWDLQTVTPGDTICLGVARFRFDSTNMPDSVLWTLGNRTFTTRNFATTDIPEGTQTIRARVRKRFASEQEGKDTTVERMVERVFVSLNEGYSLAIGKWVPVNPSDRRIDTLRVLYQQTVPGLGSGIRDFVLGATRGCDTSNTFSGMDMRLRRYAVNFMRRGGIGCPQLIGELALSSPTRGLYRYRNEFPERLVIDSIQVRRVQ